MFRVCFLPTGEIYTVFGMNGLLFLVWDEKSDSWNWLGISECAPIWEG